MKGKNIVRKDDLARNISEKYKGISIEDANVFIGMVFDAILDSIVYDMSTVELFRICTIGLKTSAKNGYDFNTGERIYDGERIKAFCKPSNYLKNQAKKMSAKFPENIGDENLA